MPLMIVWGQNSRDLGPLLNIVAISHFYHVHAWTYGSPGPNMFSASSPKDAAGIMLGLGPAHLQPRRRWTPSILVGAF